MDVSQENDDANERFPREMRQAVSSHALFGVVDMIAFARSPIHLCVCYILYSYFSTQQKQAGADSSVLVLRMDLHGRTECP